MNYRSGFYVSDMQHNEWHQHSFLQAGSWWLNMHSLLTYYFRPWCGPCKASRWFCHSILISGVNFVIALQWSWRQTNLTCLVQIWIWGNTAPLLFFTGLLCWPGWTAAVGSRAIQIGTSIPDHVVSKTGPIILDLLLEDCLPLIPLPEESFFKRFILLKMLKLLKSQNW